MRKSEMFSRTALAGAAAMALCGAGAAQAQDVIEPGTLGAHSRSAANAVSGDGVVVAGVSLSAFRWTEAGGMENLGALNIARQSQAHGVNQDGSVIVGQSNSRNNQTLAFRWTEADGMVSLGTINDGAHSFGRDVSADGTVVVGYGPDGAADTDANHAFRWTEAGGMVSLGLADGWTGASAYGVSGDGSVVVGRAATPDGSRPFRWTEADGFANLGTLPDGGNAQANAVSRDGLVVVGEGRTAGNQDRAFRWTEAGGLVSLGILENGRNSAAYDVNADGSVVVGEATTGDDGYTKRAFRWTEAGGMQTVEDWLRGAGVTLAEDITMAANGVSDDGNVVVGELADETAFIARTVTPTPDPLDGGDDGDGDEDPGGETGDEGSDGDPGGDDTGGDDAGGDNGGSGLITVDDLAGSLGAAAESNGAAVTGLTTLLNGVGSRPLDRRAAAGGSVAWAAGDLGRDDHDARDGDFTVAEIGAGSDLGGVQINGALGLIDSDQATMLGGQTEIDAGYAKIEALARLAGSQEAGLWFAATAAGLWGEADISRNYLVNGGQTDSSAGSTNLDGWGVRTRLQWENAPRYVSPYGELSWARTCMDAYAETGGAFPAAFGEVCSEATQARLGADAAFPVAPGLRVIATLAGVHQFEEDGAAVIGRVIGLNTFSFAGPDSEQTWARGGLGFAADMGASTLSVMANATTDGEGPSAWLAANWRVRF